MSSIPKYLLLILFVAIIRLSAATSPDYEPDPKNLVPAHTFPVRSQDLLSGGPDPDPENPPVRSRALARKLLSLSPPLLPDFGNADTDMHKSKTRPKFLAPIIFNPEVPPKITFPLPIGPPNTLLSVMSEPPSKEMKNGLFLAPVKYAVMHMPGDGFMPEPQPEPFI